MSRVLVGFMRKLLTILLLICACPGLGYAEDPSGCHAFGPLPDPKCTPGALIEPFGYREACTPLYTQKVRSVPASLKRRVLLAYGMENYKGPVEIDHFVSLVLGGSNEFANLWPEKEEPRPGFREKDVFETYLHHQICKGNISIEDAQSQIMTNWYKYYVAAGLDKKSKAAVGRTGSP